MLIRDVALTGPRGLMIVAFFSACMSTIGTRINWGIPYLANPSMQHRHCPNRSLCHA